MTTMTVDARPVATSRVRAGLLISAFLGIGQLPFLFIQPTDGQEGPPLSVAIVATLIGLVSVVCAIVAWKHGNRLAIRINAAVLILNAVLSLPAFFADVSAWIQVVAAIGVVLTVAALVLTLRREREPYVVTD